MTINNCNHCGGTHYGSLKCPYICERCGKDIRPDETPHCECRALITDEPDRQDDKCAACGIVRKQHDINGEAYGVCGKFVESDRQDGDGLRWKLVPVEPTQEMVRAAYREQSDTINAGFAQAYRAMVAAVPPTRDGAEGAGKHPNLKAGMAGLRAASQFNHAAAPPKPVPPAGGARSFCLWLQDYFRKTAAYNKDELTATEANTIRSTLNEMFESSERPSPAVAAEPVAWLCEDLIFPGQREAITNRDIANVRMHQLDAWKLTPLYASPTVRGDREAYARAICKADGHDYDDELELATKFETLRSREIISRANRYANAILTALLTVLAAWHEPLEYPTEAEQREAEQSATNKIDEIARAALTAALSNQTETIRACARSTLIGFQSELGDRNIEFICDQIARKATMSDQAGGWQDISTAPKDGTRVLCFWPGDTQAGEGSYYEVGCWSKGRWRRHIDDEGHWNDPTRWAALLAPPPSSPAGESQSG